MRTHIIACKTLQDELEHLLIKHSLDCRLSWIESGLHDTPEKLHARLQRELDAVTDAGRVLLAMGRCGNSVQGVKNGNFELILPRVDDCISLFFGSDEARSRYARENAALYMTGGWLRRERNPVVEYRHCVEEYGEEDASDILSMMYGRYRQLALLDTGVYPLETLLDETAPLEDFLGLRRAVVPATLDRLDQLLTGPWDEARFYRFAPGTVISFPDCGGAGTPPSP